MINNEYNLNNQFQPKLLEQLAQTKAHNEEMTARWGDASRYLDHFLLLNTLQAILVDLREAETPNKSSGRMINSIYILVTTSSHHRRRSGAATAPQTSRRF